MGAGNISGTNPFKLLTNGTVTVAGTLSASGQYWIQLVNNNVIYKQIQMASAATSFSLKFTHVLADTYSVCYNSGSTAVGSTVASVTSVTYAVESSSFNFILNFPSGVQVTRKSDEVALSSGALILKGEKLNITLPSAGYYINGIKYDAGTVEYQVGNDIDIITGIQDYDTATYTNPKYIEQLTTNILDNYKKYLISTTNTNPTAKTLTYNNGKWNKSDTIPAWTQPYSTITITSKNSDGDNITLTGGDITVTDVTTNNSSSAAISGSTITSKVPRGHRFKITSTSFTGYNAMSQIDGYADQDYGFDYSFAGCGNTCVGQCTSCTSACSQGCAGNCTGSCKDTCTGGCSSTCKGTCTGGCTSCSSCSGSCTGGCNNACASCNACGGCSGCKGTCTNHCAGCTGCFGGGYN